MQQECLLTVCILSGFLVLLANGHVSRCSLLVFFQVLTGSLHSGGTVVQDLRAEADIQVMTVAVARYS